MSLHTRCTDISTRYKYILYIFFICMEVAESFEEFQYLRERVCECVCSSRFDSNCICCSYKISTSSTTINVMKFTSRQYVLSYNKLLTYLLTAFRLRSYVRTKYYLSIGFSIFNRISK